MDLNPSAARSLEEGLDETLTVHRLRVPELLRRTLASTNLIESAFSVTSDTQITAVSPPGGGTVDVTVATPAGASATSPADEFTYVPAPSVAGVSPNRGPAAGGTAVTVTGTGFTRARQVTFGTAVAGSLKVVSDTQITAVSPPGTGTVDVVVTTIGGSSSTGAPDRFTYFPP